MATDQAAPQAAEGGEDTDKTPGALRPARGGGHAPGFDPGHGRRTTRDGRIGSPVAAGGAGELNGRLAGEAGTSAA